MTQLYLVLLALQNERSLKEPRVWQCLYPRFHSRRKDATSSRVISTLFQLLVNTLLLSPNGNAALEGLNYATPWHNVSCHVVSWHVTSRHVTSRHVTILSRTTTLSVARCYKYSRNEGHDSRFKASVFFSPLCHLLPMPRLPN